MGAMLRLLWRHKGIRTAKILQQNPIQVVVGVSRMVKYVWWVVVNYWDCSL